MGFYGGPSLNYTQTHRFLNYKVGFITYQKQKVGFILSRGIFFLEWWFLNLDFISGVKDFLVGFLKKIKIWTGSYPWPSSSLGLLCQISS